MKKLRKLSYAATFLLALGLSFAFTNKKAAYTGTVYVQTLSSCDPVYLDDPYDTCDTINPGSVCQYWDDINGYENIYANTYPNGVMCLQPLRNWY